MNLNQFFKSVDGAEEKTYTDKDGNIKPAAKMNELVANILWKTSTSNADIGIKLYILAQKIYQWKDVKNIDIADIKLIKETVASNPDITVGAKGQILIAIDEKK